MRADADFFCLPPSEKLFFDKSNVSIVTLDFVLIL